MHSTKHFILAGLILYASMTAAEDNALFGELDAGNQAFAKAILANDVDYLVNDYTDDACVIAPSTPRTCGKEAIRAFWTAVTKSGPKDVKIVTLAVGSSSDLAHATGTLEITGANDATQMNNFVLVLKRINGSWKLHLDTWTPQ